MGARVAGAILKASGASVPSVVVCAAIKNKKDIVICGPKYYDPIMQAQIAVHGGNWRDVEFGFIDQYCNFITKAEALILAKSNSQIKLNTQINANELKTSNLY